MKVVCLVCCVSSFLVLSTCAHEKFGGFVISSNKHWIRNHTNPLLISNFVWNHSFHELFIKVELSSVHPDTISYHQAIDFGEVKPGDVIYQVATPDVGTTFNLKVKISNDNSSYSFQKDFPITAISQEDFTSIHTNKPFYKPSDNVRIRVLTLDGKNFLPQDNKIIKAYIRDPKNTIVGQWLNPSSKSGIYDFVLPLSSEPRLGEWNFVIETHHSKKTKRFEVMQYVPPKFSVTVESNPKHLFFAYGINISYKACAKYSYGKPVSGDVYFKLPDGSEHSHELDRAGCYRLDLENFEIVMFGFRLTHNFNILVTVTERETGISNNIYHETNIYKAIYLKYSPFCKDHIKPGIAYHCYMRAYYDEHVYAKGVKFTIYERKRGLLDEVVADENGVISIKVPPIISEELTYQSIMVGPERPYFLVDMNKDLFLKRWVSPNSNYLSVINNCDANGYVSIEPFNLTFSLVSKVPLTFENALFRYVVYSEGQPFKVGNFTLDFSNEDHFEVESLSSNSSIPSEEQITFQHYKHSRTIDLHGIVGMVRFLLFTEIEGEIVADNIKFRVQFKPKNQVQIKFSTQKLQPGLKTHLHINFPGKSLCSLNVYDKSLEALSEVEYLKYEEIHEHWKVGQPDAIKDQKSCNAEDPANSLASSWDSRGRPTFVGSRDSFELDGLTVHSDFEVSKEFCKPFDLVEEAVPEFITLRSTLPSEYSQVSMHRDFFPESWIWDLFEIEEGDEGKNISLTLPHTITEWSGNGFCVGSETGLAIAPKFSIIGFQPFFLALNLPYSIIKGERAIVPLSIHSYLPSCFEVELNITHDKHLNVYKLKSNKMVVCEGVPKVVNLTIGAKKVGKVNLTIQATLDENSLKDDNITAQDSVTYEVLIESEGKPEEVTRSIYVCSPASGELLLQPPGDNIVKDSIKSFIAVSGDLLASALANLENLLGLPTGCGEQIMVKFVPNIYVLNYLKRSKLLTEDIERKAVNYLNVGYQRSLQFRRNDGSYSAFGQKDPQGSLWLTAFVVKSLAAAREHIHLDSQDFVASLDFIQDFQFTNGCFPLAGELFQRSLMGHMEEDGLVPSVAYNAYIVSSLIEAGLPLDDVSVLKGYECLEKNLFNLSKNALYDNVLLLYAYSLVIHSRQSYLEAYDKLLAHIYSSSVDGEGVYWNLGKDNEAVNVEMTSYVVLSALRSNQPDLSKLLKTASWLSGKQNPRGGFYSTQDTVVALNALSTLAQHISDPSNATVTFPTLKKIHPFYINSSNKLLQQKVETGNLLNKNIKYSVTGDGCVTIQAVTKVNIMTFTGDQHSISIFNMSVGLKPVESTCKQMILHICFAYNGEEETTNMGLVVVNLPTGWLADRDSLEFLLQYAQVSLKNYEMNGNSIKFYFNEITKLETCFHFMIFQDVFVHQTKPARVEIFDYYDLNISTFVEYVIYQKCATPEKKSELLPPLPDLQYRVARSALKRCPCPFYFSSPYSQDVKHACSKKYSYWLRKTEEGNFGLISSNYVFEEKIQKLSILFKNDCNCIQTNSTTWEDVVVNTDEKVGHGNILQLQGDDVVLELDHHSPQGTITSLASNDLTRSQACMWWLYE